MSQLSLILLLCLLLPLLLGLGARRALSVFVVRIAGGEVVSARGRLPKSLLTDLAAVARRAGCSGVIRARRRRGALDVQISSGIDPGTSQQFRNVIGQVPFQRVISAAKLSR
ncbi:MAG TPA: DUF3634 family protein [Polyangiaceae bacterium]|jgi:hypothetical protein|nr:DUF3634 family protein [Polyangiaceae bacterium]